MTRWCRYVLVIALCSGAAAAARNESKDEGVFSEKTFRGLELRAIGPALMSGRVADIAIHPDDRNTRYVAVGSGHLWKTENAGTTWTPLFEQESSYSLGAVTIDPRHPEVLWLGTGENVGGRHVGYGDGVYKSVDAGAHWTRMGLEESEHIGRILVDPRDSDVVWVAAQGPLWSAGGDRGLFRTKDGGKTWENVLSGGPYTGVNDVLFDPRDPDTLYAATHQRLRTVAALVNGGPESAIHKSTDGGETWRELEEGLPEGDLGRIGLALSPQNPDVVYATIELPHRKGGLWRSSDAGGSWEKRSDYAAGGTGPHYYQELFASPHAFDRIYHMDVRLHVSEDGGKTWRNIEGEFKHVDNHAMAFDPDDPDYLLVGCDGGLYESWDLGETWKYTANLPVTQFYKVAVDYDEPFYNVYGGTQDNNTQGGPSRTDNHHGIRNGDWFITLGGDGHQPAVDPTNPDIVYSEWQGGNLVRFDRKTGESVYIKPQPREGEPQERFNWDAPILISAHDPARLYFASHRLWRSDDRGDSWRPVSADLTRDLDRKALPMMGRVQSYDAVWDLYAMSRFGTVTSIGESPLDENLLYVGSDDGLLHVTADGGKTWTKCGRPPGPSDRYFVNDVKADLHERDTVYVVVDDHKRGDFAPYVYKSTNRGKTWKSIRANLPDRRIAWRIVQDHVDPDLLFLGTELGVFFSTDAGARWIELTGNVPNIPFRDLAIQRRENDLVGATFGRGFYILDDYSPLRDLDEKALEREAILFEVREADWYVERQGLGGGTKASQGDAFFVAPNPPFGATFTYYLKEDYRTRKEVRRAAEKEAEEDGLDTPHPGWDAIREEALEDPPAIRLTVTDRRGRVVRHVTGEPKAGFHRASWDLRYPSHRNKGFLAAPGTYRVHLEKRVDGEYVSLAEPRTFEVVARGESTLRGATPAVADAFARELGDTQRQAAAARSAIRHTRERLDAVLEALERSMHAEPDLERETRALRRELSLLEERLAGDRRRGVFGDEGPVPVLDRLFVADVGTRRSSYGPTPTHRESLDIAKRALAGIREDVNEIVRERLPGLEERLDAAGVPWTPGRGAATGGL